MILIKKLILPVGLVFAFIFAVLCPDIGVFCKKYYGLQLTVIIIFLVGGYVQKFSNFKFDMKFFGIMMLSIVSGLFILPFIGMVFAHNILPITYASGIMVIAAMPPTLSSGIVITENAGGDSILAMILTVSLNLIGLITIPVVIKLIFSNMSSINVHSEELFFKLLLIIFVPFVIGNTLKRVKSDIKGIVYIKLLPSIMVVLGVWICLSTSIGFIEKACIEDLIMIVVTSVLIHTTFLAFNFAVAKILRISSESLEAFLFVVSQKTMPLAILVLVSVCKDFGRGVIACVIYHFMQILYDSVLASIVSKRKNRLVVSIES